MKDDIMMQKGYAAVRDKSNDRTASSEDEMNFNERQVLEASGKDQLNRSDNIPLVNPNRNPNIDFSPADGSKS